MYVIVAVDQHWGIGHEGDLQFRIKADLRRFRTLTIGKVVILGRKTLQTFPQGRPLPGRTNVILSRIPGWTVDGAVIYRSINDLLLHCTTYDQDDLFVIGGASIYEALLPYCKRVYVTRVHAVYPADRFFPNLDQLPNWHLVAEEPVQEEDGLEFSYLTYEHA
jgi:dihydrofolate reductase